MNKKILVICGPTATGKTELAMHLGKLIDGELLSADSRQVYRGLNIGTGKDLSKDAEYVESGLIGTRNKLGFYLIKNPGIRLWGYDLVDPTDEFSVSDYLEAASVIIDDIWLRKKVPIVVGGTGFFINAVLRGVPTAVVPRNEKLRMEIERKSVHELYGMLFGIDRERAELMNNSDKNNPRRLIRAIEVASYGGKKGSVHFPQGASVLQIGLSASKETIKSRIQKRVLKRVGEGIKSEIGTLLGSGVTWDMQSMNTLGYKEWRNFFEGNTGEKDVLESWTMDEFKYAKRQMTWFKKDKDIVWFDTEESSLRNEVENLVQKWNNLAYA